MIGHKHPSITAGLGLRQDRFQAIQKITAISGVFKNCPVFNAADENVMQCAWCIYAMLCVAYCIFNIRFIAAKCKRVQKP